MLAEPSATGSSAQPTAAASCARQPPPSSRTISATSTITPIPAARQVRRSATSELPGDRVDEPADPGGERREVDVAERRAPRRREEVELVAVPAVAAEERELERRGERPAGEPAEQRRAEPCQLEILLDEAEEDAVDPLAVAAGTPCASRPPA